ncbi:hypothetical protein CAEBREN_16446 [Caenorhabditis brenneri]|uniref:Domain of unknown function WSN domain-containing protein n=1 Tax=Caenorhabditis brenneri TaxID=135651 RepID=G0MF10_CAEBE|nr:hypothetical protein CAEBREN_16446 [Caenorhabditis brenneri]
MLILQLLLLLPFVTTDTVDSEARVKRNENSFTIDETISNHLKLGNILDALFINSKLFKKEISGEKLLTSVHGMPDVKPLRKLLQFNENNFMASIEKIESELAKISLNIEPFDLAAIENILPKISFLNSTVLNWIRESTLEKNTPDSISLDFVESQITLNPLYYFYQFKYNGRFGDSIEKCILMIGGVMNFREKVNEELKNENRQRKLWDDLKIKVKYGKWLHENQLHFEDLSKAPQKTPGLLDYLKNEFPFEDVLQDGLYIQNWHRALHNPRGENNIGASFIDQHIHKIYGLLKDKWVEKILINDQKLENLQTSVLQMLSYTKQFTSVNYYMNVVIKNPQTQYHLDVLMDFLIDMKRLHWYAVNLENLKRCLTFKEKLDVSSFDIFLNDDKWKVNQYYEVLGNLSAVLDEYDTDGTILHSLEKIRKYSGSEIKEIIKHWNDTKSVDFQNIESIMTNSSCIKLFSKLYLPKTFGVLGFLQEITKSMNEIKQWISLDKDSCDAWVPVDFGNFSTYNLFPQTIKRLSDAHPHSNFKEFFAKIKALREELQLLESVKVSKPGLLVQNQHRQFQVQDDLMEVGNIFRTLHNIREIHQKMEDLKTILEVGDLAVKKIEEVKHPRHIVILESAWKDWGNMKEDLERIQKSVEEVVRIFDTSPETSLKDIGKKYIAISNIRFTKDIYHKPYFNFGEKHDSLRLLDLSDSNIQKLSYSLESLRKPMNIDWAWVGDRFGNLALFLENVEKAMKEFHKLKAPLRRHSKWLAWKEQKIKNEKLKAQSWTYYLFQKSREFGVGAVLLGAQIGLLIYFMR